MKAHYYTVRNNIGMSVVGICGQNIMKITFTERCLPQVSRVSGCFKKHPDDDISEITHESFKSWIETAFIHLKLYANDPRFN